MPLEQTGGSAIVESLSYADTSTTPQSSELNNRPSAKSSAAGSGGGVGMEINGWGPASTCDGGQCNHAEGAVGGGSLDRAADGILADLHAGCGSGEGGGGRFDRG